MKTVIKAKVYKYERHFEGFPKEGDLKMVEETLSPIKNGGKQMQFYNKHKCQERNDFFMC